jgi:hypothetical protein
LYPEVDVTLFTKSATSIQKLLKDATSITNKLATSPSFAREVMSAAQQSKEDEVKRLLRSAGIQSKLEVSFNPNTIHVTLSPKKGDFACCQLTFLLYWR